MIKILDIIFPKQCEFCGGLGQYICDNCYEKLKTFQVNNNYKDNDSQSNSFFLYKYEDVIRKLILNYKFDDKSYLCAFFKECILRNKKALNFIKQYNVIIPVPIHIKRKLERGYNQSEIIAKRLVYDLNKMQNSRNVKKIVVNTKSLIKVKNVSPQSMKNKFDREKSIKNVYKVQKIDCIKSKKVLIFDDIYTTGSTYNECKKCLLENAEVKSVGIMTIAKDFLNK